MAWVESHQTLSKHRKTLRAVGLLQVDRHKFIGHMHQLWWWAVDNLPKNGCLGDLTNYEIAIAAEWDGNADRFVKALTDASFIDEDGPDRYLHEWYNYAGRLLEKREKNADRQKAYRDRQRMPIFERDQGRCRYCGVQVTVSTFIVDHVIPPQLGGTDDAENLATSCNSCNTKKGRRTPGEAGMELLPVSAVGQRNASRNADVDQRNRATVPYRTVPNHKKESVASGNAASESAHSDGNAAQDPESDSIQCATPPYTAEFEQFWAAYPRRKEKQGAFRVWKARLKERHTPGEMIRAAEAYAGECRRRSTELRFIKLAGTFLGPDKHFLEYAKGVDREESALSWIPEA